MTLSHRVSDTRTAFSPSPSHTISVSRIDTATTHQAENGSPKSAASLPGVRALFPEFPDTLASEGLLSLKNSAPAISVVPDSIMPTHPYSPDPSKPTQRPEAGPRSGSSSHTRKRSQGGSGQHPSSGGGGLFAVLAPTTSGGLNAVQTDAASAGSRPPGIVRLDRTGSGPVHPHTTSPAPLSHYQHQPSAVPTPYPSAVPLQHHNQHHPGLAQPSPSPHHQHPASPHSPPHHSPQPNSHQHSPNPLLRSTSQSYLPPQRSQHQQHQQQPQWTGIAGLGLAAAAAAQAQTQQTPTDGGFGAAPPFGGFGGNGFVQPPAGYGAPSPGQNPTAPSANVRFQQGDTPPPFQTHHQQQQQGYFPSPPPQQQSYHQHQSTYANAAPSAYQQQQHLPPTPLPTNLHHQQPSPPTLPLYPGANVGPGGMTGGGPMGGQFGTITTTSGGAAKKHACPVCGSSFSRPSELKTHSHKHTGERPYECSLCGRHFSTSSNLGRHIRSIHPREKAQGLVKNNGSAGSGGVKSELVDEEGSVSSPSLGGSVGVGGYGVIKDEGM